jgi:hypothetical protein
MAYELLFVKPIPPTPGVPDEFSTRVYFALFGGIVLAALWWTMPAIMQVLWPRYSHMLVQERVAHVRTLKLYPHGMPSVGQRFRMFTTY